MENVYQHYHFPCTEKVDNLKEYFKSYSEMCQLESIAKLQNLKSGEELLETEFSNILGNEAKVNDFSQLSQRCSIEKLTVPNEVAQREVHISNKYTMKLRRDYAIPEEAKNLETIQAKLKYIKHQPRQKEFDNIVLMHSQNDLRDIEPGSEVIIVVRIYHPFDKKLYNRYDRMKCSHEIIMLGSQTLADLRDKILCANDTGFCIEVKELTNEVPVSDVKSEYPSGLMCIDDVLYNDLRNPNAVDYSIVVQKWAKDKKLGDFPRKNMNEVCLHDLRFRFGYPYIYQHRGDCEHIMVFGDARLIKSSDSLSVKDYPYYRTINRYNAQHCNICRTSTAKWMCIDSDRLPHDRTYLCQDCHVSYNFIRGERVGNFKAFPYFDKSVVI